jgi:pimeloyl-ACP methyl ester carboxylesterase
VIRQIANATFAQLLDTISVNQGDAKAFDPLPVAQAHRHRLLAINMTHGNLEAFAGEQLAANGVLAKLDKTLSSITTPSIVIEGSGDQLVKPKYAQSIARELPHAREEMLKGGHMQPYAHPAAIAAAVESLAGH